MLIDRFRQSVCTCSCEIIILQFAYNSISNSIIFYARFRFMQNLKWMDLLREQNDEQ